MRTYLLMVVALGVLASIMTHHSGSSAPSPVAATVTTANEYAATPAPEVAPANGETTELERNPDGHFYADVEVNGTKLHMLVDTGATAVALSREDAHAAGIPTSIGMNDIVGEGADGSIHGENVAIDRISLGGTTARNVSAVVLNSGERSLLGQNFLANFDSIEIHGDRMILR
jgi:aspartyl protease family protein